MRVQALKRIKRPCDFVEPLFERPLTLHPFQVKTRLKVSILFQDRQHMRMHRGAALFEGGKRVSKADHQAAFERPEHYAACVLGCNQGSRGHDVEIAESPRFLLNLLYRVMLRLALDIAN